MALTSGDKLGPYEIVAPVGAGGMGEVYRAHDPRLDRDVAIKVIPTSFASDISRLRRFEQEARAAAALNHPNILAVHDIGAHEGSPYIVSELLEGETLRAKLQPGPLPLRKGVDYAIQIAHGLAAAHDKGIAHRDLKPDNIFITRDGRVKILDFGLAKLTRPEASSVEATQTLQSETGIVVGTAGYMSPEQVRGKPTDTRTDLFSFGAILYELFSGQRAFKGDTAADTMTAILTKEPPELTQRNVQVPAALERVVRHCLEKSVEERFQSARDVAFNLELLSSPSGTAPAPAAAQAVLASERHRRLVAGIAAVLLIAVAAGMFFAGRRSAPNQSPVFHQLTFRRGMVGSARFAPDGSTVIYGAAWSGRPFEMFSTRIDSLASRPMDLPPADIIGVTRSGDLALLLDKRRVFTWVNKGTLARVPLAGGAPREILEDVYGGDISPDGTQFAMVRQAGLVQKLEFPIGKALYETHGYIDGMRISPDGEKVAFLDHPIYGDSSAWVALIDRSGRKLTLTGQLDGLTGLAWTPSGDEIWFTGPGVRAVTPSGKVRTIMAPPTQLVLHDISRDGRVLLSSVYTRSRIFGLVAGDEHPRDLSWLSEEDIAGLSEDGKVLAITEYSGEYAGVNYPLMVRHTDGSPAVQIGQGAGLAVSPDGKWVAAMLLTDPQHMLLFPTGAGESRNLDLSPVEADLRYALIGWTRDGIVFPGRERGAAERGYLLNVRTGKVRAITPDGVQVAYLAPTGELVFAAGPDHPPAVFPLGGGAAKPLKVEANESVIGWDTTGENLYVWSGQYPARVILLNVKTGQRKLWKEITPPDPTGVLFGRMLITPDGKTCVYRYRQWLSDLYVAQGLR